MQTIFIKEPARMLDAFAGSVQSADGCAICRFSSIRGFAQRNRAKSADCADPATAHNTSMNAKHSHSIFILSRGDMVRHDVGVCVYTCARCACAVNL